MRLSYSKRQLEVAFANKILGIDWLFEQASALHLINTWDLKNKHDSLSI